MRRLWTRLVDALSERQTNWRELQHQRDNMQLFLLAVSYEKGFEQARALAQEIVSSAEQATRASSPLLMFRRALSVWKHSASLEMKTDSPQHILDDQGAQSRLIERVNARQVHNLLAAAASMPTSASAATSGPAFTLSLRPSQSNVNAGYGVILNGHARMGSVVAFYPGIAYRVRHWTSIPGYPYITAQNPYLFARYDRVIVDANPNLEVSRGLMNIPILDHALESVVRHTRQTESLHECWVGLNPYALGHRVNHPPRGREANVMPCAWNFDLQRLEPSLLSFIPNRLFTKYRQLSSGILGPTSMLWSRFRHWFDSLGHQDNMSLTEIPGVVLIALRDLQDEELFLNYRYNPAALERLQAPSWYWQPDQEAAKRRWSS
ncbi:hypothetical protein, conserved [Cyanidioschyzon merolae strain 10D]|jgi:hypothetical protein|uniref:SET domain-containing protein n=1 Tax=Cyanidioschyzon merolae (strain NIES-3377 / 10D) TaxID=280699 RepID=M1VFU5_CYAM1|nr:hypothetical protein, conserved [Cyanidioschyzon merolae strain 10D]BAM81877.1 hypothetical protein, conserved [Cyanidioschyzon merolae strain 10D]|eukprot:XP_005537913.1 hypothetical protein, conserved [Cyanidioschyzon merolae strain 10D]